MTRKQYQKRVMQMQRNLNAYAKANGMKTSKTVDIVRTPAWGTIINTGKHKGERLTSYEQCWDMLCEVLAGTPAMTGLE